MNKERGENQSMDDFLHLDENQSMDDFLHLGEKIKQNYPECFDDENEKIIEKIIDQEKDLEEMYHYKMEQDIKSIIND